MVEPGSNHENTVDTPDFDRLNFTLKQQQSWKDIVEQLGTICPDTQEYFINNTKSIFSSIEDSEKRDNILKMWSKASNSEDTGNMVVFWDKLSENAYGLEYAQDDFIDVVENYYTHTAELQTAVSDDVYSSWQGMLKKLDGKDNVSSFIETSTDKLTKLKEEDVQQRYIGAVKHMNELNSKIFNQALGRGDYFARNMDPTEIEEFNTLASQIRDITPNRNYQAYLTNSKRFGKLENKSRIISIAKEAANANKAGFARAILDNGQTIEQMDNNTAKDMIEKGSALYDDNFFNAIEPNALSARDYGAFVRMMPRFAKLEEDTYSVWKDNLDEIKGTTKLKNDFEAKGKYLCISEVFFKEVDDSDVHRFLTYNAEIMKKNKDVAIHEMKYLGYLSHKPDFVKDFVLSLGEKVSSQPTALSRNYMENTIRTLSSLHSEEQYKNLYHAESMLEDVRPTLAQTFMENVGTIFSEFDSRVLVDWARKGLSVYNDQGEVEASKYFKMGLTRGFIEEMQNKYHFITFEDIAGAASAWMSGLLGKKVALAKASGNQFAKTDNETIYLPSRIDKYGKNELNKKLYWGLLDHEMAHIKYGSFDVDLAEALKDYEKKSIGKTIHNLVEDGRIEHKLRKEFGSVVADELDFLNETYNLKGSTIFMSEDEVFMNVLLQKVKTGKESKKLPDQYKEAFDYCYAAYEDAKDGDIYDSWAATRKIYDKYIELFPETDKLELPQNGESSVPDPYANIGDDDGSGDGGSQGAEKENQNEEKDNNQGAPSDKDNSNENGEPEIDKEKTDSGDIGEEENDSTGTTDDSGDPSDGNDTTSGDSDSSDGDLDSGDYGESASMMLEYDPLAAGGNKPVDRNEVIGKYHFDEFDNVLGDYLVNHTTVYELINEEASDSFYRRTMSKYGGLAQEISKNMEELKPTKIVKQKRQADGSEIDLDAYIDAWGEKKSGADELDEHIFENGKKTGRDVAVFILVDQSTSTMNEKIVKEAESLCIFGDALENLGDQFAMYGFNSSKKDNVRLYRIKSFEESYGPTTHGRIEGIHIDGATRMGPAVRFAMDQLEQVDAGKKIFLYLTDGQPNDYDDSPNCKDKSYVFADIHKAIEDGSDAGIESYAITIDTGAEQYLPDIFGEGNYAVISDVEELSREIALFYEKVSYDGM